MSWSKPDTGGPGVNHTKAQSGLKVHGAKNAGIFTGNKTPKAPPPAAVPPARKGGTKV